MRSWMQEAHQSNFSPCFCSVSMSALGQKRTFGPRNLMSALPPKADIVEGDWHVRFVPKADILRQAAGAIALSAIVATRTKAIVRLP